MNINIFEEIFNILNQYENIDKLIIKNIDINILFSQNTFMDNIFKRIDSISTEETYTKVEIIDDSLVDMQCKSNVSNVSNVSNLQVSESDKIINIFIKKYYKIIILLLHPDKTDDINKHKLFIKTKEYYENNLIIGIIKSCNYLNIKIDDISEIIFNRILIEIRYIEQLINNIINCSNIIVKR